eukprot:GHVN01083726.1.p4 GENE.GHVN01083726.1~~GHVN01083726.1.p4  ORF type:complete len:184 (+),score=16.70 GHVN01083726.1:1576-2127(+)
MTMDKFLTAHYLVDAQAPGSAFTGVLDSDDGPSKRIGYLAQHSLFDHIQPLDRDLATPDYALCGKTDELIRMGWMGPAGTVSPLHTDPYHNVYAQIVGAKYVRLYAPQQGANLYPFEMFLKNTSRVSSDITSPMSDNSKYPLFKTAQYQETLLLAGDLLFIPNGWWHFIKSVKRSISVSFWFD